MKTTVAVAVAVFVAAAAAAHAEPVFVPGNASGYFGKPVNMKVPLVPALAVIEPGTITITYVDGMVDYGGPVEVGPNGGQRDVPLGEQTPLQQAQGFAGPISINSFAALMGAFVRQTRVDAPGFMATDSTKLPSILNTGIAPCELFLVGQSVVIHAEGPGTLFLGINDPGVADNGGGFNVEVTTP
jgi:hypothetical protein